MTAGSAPILAIEALETRVRVGQASFPAVDGVSLSLHHGESLAIVGESGCGKSMLALSVMGLLEPRVARIVSGRVLFDGADLARLPERRLRAIRGRDISMIFQEPMSSLNPVLTVGRQVAEVVRQHEGLSPRAAWERAVEMLALVQIPDPRSRAGEFPHQLSGGMRQRVLIAIALACAPRVLLADEPTTALDVTVQAQILDLILSLQERLSMALVLITHDLAVVAETVSRVIVMYAGRKIEEAATTALFARPAHPYTKGLLGSLPSRARADGTRRLTAIRGVVPPLSALRRGCLFASRCPHAVDRCRVEAPELAPIETGHVVACWRAGELWGR
ncbi:MAG: ABC transporter ATP-binding protein [Azospirillaceae bacterium]